MRAPAWALFACAFFWLGSCQPAFLTFATSAGVSIPNGDIDLYAACLRAHGVNTSELVTRPGADVQQSLLGSTGDNSYTELNHQWNKCCGYKAPAAYFVTRSVTDVQIGVRCAHMAGVRIVAKSGGHSYGKYAFGDNATVVIDLRNLNEIRVSKGNGKRGSGPTATIGPGVLMGQITYGLYNSPLGNFVIPFGDCQTNGMAYGLGGGFSHISSLYGMNVDALLELRVVNAVGDLLTANPRLNPDLFWALRGGSAGSFGIVTQFKYRLYPAPVAVARGQKLFPFTEFEAVYSAWEAMLRADPPPPNSVHSILRIFPSDSRGALRLLVNQFQVGNASATGMREVKTLLAKFPNHTLEKPVYRSVPFLRYVVEAANESHDDNITDPSQLPLQNRTSFNPQAYALYAKTFYVPRAASSRPSATDLQRMRTKLAAIPDKISVVLRQLGGAIAAVSPSATAFVHRGQNLYEVDMFYSGPGSGANDYGPPPPATKRWMTEYYDMMKDIVHHTESFQNHLDLDLKDYLQRYYGQNLPRLVRVKDAYDPDNFFNNPQSIPTSMLYENRMGVSR